MKLFHLLLLAVLPLCTVLAQQQSPNILLIIADDMGIDVTEGFGIEGDKPVTPTLDSLRANGLTFTNCWATPQCTPTRAAIMSGKYGIKTGVMRPPGPLDTIHTSLFKKINANSLVEYQSAVIGKWHIGGNNDYDHPAATGVSHYEGLFNSSVDSYYDWQKVTNGSLEQITEYTTTHLTDAAVDWVAEQDAPWFLWLAHVAPHAPFEAPPEGLYSTEPVDNRSTYFAMIEAMDSEINRLLASLDDDVRDETIVVFVGDNGTPNGVGDYYPSGHGKGSVYEGGLRVPMIIAGKSVSRSGETDDNLVQVTDLHATILELVGMQVAGGVDNSLSLKPLLSCSIDNFRSINYSDYNNDGLLQWATRTDQYKLIEDENGQEEFYDLIADPKEESNLITSLDAAQESIRDMLKIEAAVRRTDWSCSDGIGNGEETTIDDCDNTCETIDELSFENIGCCDVPEYPSVHWEYMEGDQRVIYTNSYPNHNYCYNTQIPAPNYRLYRMDAEPSFSGVETSVSRSNGTPANYFGVALNGVFMMPAPALPFVFENEVTGEYNWDWVFEPTANQGAGQGLVRLDCASAHTNSNGYHYHGNMFEFVEQLEAGISLTTDIPSEPLQIGWASDGFPVLYKFGPDSEGNMKEMLPSYQLRSGLRPGDGIAAPCGPYSGKYTNDYEYICGKGDLNQCNGIEATVTLPTITGDQTFDFYYVITSDFPQIPRCMLGNFSDDFRSAAASLEGEDLDGDGFIDSFDCDDTNPDINPLADEIPGNNIDENCDGIITSTEDLYTVGFILSPNPNRGAFVVTTPDAGSYQATLFSINGSIASQSQGSSTIEFNHIEPGMYILAIHQDDIKIGSTKVIVHD